MSRLEEIKQEVYRISAIKEASYAMLPKDVEKLQVIRLESVKWLISRVKELEEENEIYKDFITDLANEAENIDDLLHYREMAKILIVADKP